MEGNRRKRKIAVKVAACVGSICSIGFAVILGSISQLKTEGDLTKRLLMRFMYFTLFFNWTGILSSYQIIKRLAEKKISKNSRSVKVYRESRKCFMLALSWLMIAFINGIAILFMGIFYLPDSFALIAVSAIALNIAMTMVWLHRWNTSDLGRVLATFIWFSLIFSYWIFHLCRTMWNERTNTYRFTTLIVFWVILYVIATITCLLYKQMSKTFSMPRSSAGRYAAYNAAPLENARNEF